MSTQTSDYTVVVIGTGFGGAMTALPLARKFVERNQGEKVLMLERGTWWTTPVNTVQDQEVSTYDRLVSKGQPVQFWSSLNHFRGFIDLFTRCFRRNKNEDGLFEFTRLGKRGFLGLFGNQNDGVSIIRANGVGGGSLVYSNITIRPPDLVLDDPRWPEGFRGKVRNDYFELARLAISRGVLFALNERAKAASPPLFILEAGAPNTGLSNIVTRSGGLNPHWLVKPDPLNPKRGLKQINLKRTGQKPDSPDLDPKDDKRDFKNDLWLSRARVFQTAMAQLTSDFGTVDLSINDYEYDPDPKKNGSNQYDSKTGDAKNYCERHGRCNVGCLPGARHTLNKQYMAAIFGTPKHPEPVFHKQELQIEPLSEVDVIVARPQRGYEIHYIQRDPKDMQRATRKVVTADRVILAAGCLGTSEILLRSKVRGTLPNLSDRVGFGFSTNGDYVAFLEETKERVSLVRGPVTTSFGHFNTEDAGTGGDSSTFHTIEDQGIPPALASTIGVGVPLIRSLANGRDKRLFIIWAIILWALKRARHYLRAFRVNFRERQDIFQSEDEITSKMMCIVAMGREASVGQFRLGTSRGETSLRVKRTDNRPFHEDPIYEEIRKSLDRLAGILSPAGKKGEFLNPFFNRTATELKAESIALSHPLGGCIIGKNAASGAVDEYGRVFDKTKTSDRPFYEGLYIADGSVVPTALGVNPSLTISALALRIGDKIIEELPPIGTP